jgi:hypothetical protein
MTMGTNYELLAEEKTRAVSLLPDLEDATGPVRPDGPTVILFPTPLA